jgi:hypothetical protein
MSQSLQTVVHWVHRRSTGITEPSSRGGNVTGGETGMAQKVLTIRAKKSRSTHWFETAQVILALQVRADPRKMVKKEPPGHPRSM